MTTIKTYITTRTDTFGANAGKGLIEEISPLSNVLESLCGDGEQAKLKRVLVCADINEAHSGIGVNLQGAFYILQTTDGAFTHSFNEDDFIVDDLFDSTVSDEFAIQRLTDFKTAVFTGGWTSTYFYQARWRFELPQRILRLLEKEQNTEKLQNLYLMFVGYSHATHSDIGLMTNIQWDYTIASKPLTIR